VFLKTTVVGTSALMVLSVAVMKTDSCDSLGDQEVTYSCVPVGTGYADGFFSLEAFRGKLYAGQFGYGHESQSMLYSYPPWELVQPGLTGVGESVCALLEFDGYLYANTENSGDIFRSPDGRNWERVYDGPAGSIGCGLAEFNGSLYAINYGYATSDHGRVLRLDAGGWTTVYDSGNESLYVREIVAYRNRLYAFGVLGDQGKMLSSPNGSDWTLENVPERFFRAHVWDGYLWLGSTEKYTGGTAGVWRFDGTNFDLLYVTDREYVTDIRDMDGHLFAGTSNGWKEDTGPSYLLMSPDGVSDWQRVCQFGETAIWALGVLDGELYVGTWQYGVGGSVYQVVASTQPPPTPRGDCEAIAEHPDWELCESGPGYCAGVFLDGAGCQAFCAAAGLNCAESYGGQEGCIKEPENPLYCGETGHNSDWCECR